MILQAMFATNNHSPEIVSKENIEGSRKFLVGEKAKRTECKIVFKTEKSEYTLRRCFFGSYSVEARLQKTDSTVTYFGNDVIQMLSKFQKPFVIGEGALFNTGSVILKPDSDFTRSSMAALANNWARMVGVQESRIGLDHAGRWSTSDGEQLSYRSGYHNRRLLPSPLLILAQLAQAVMRKRKFGKCPPVLSPFNVESLNQFEAIAILDLIKNVSQEESLQFIVGVNSKPEINSIIEVISTPKLSIYEKI